MNLNVTKVFSFHPIGHTNDSLYEVLSTAIPPTSFSSISSPSSLESNISVKDSNKPDAPLIDIDTDSDDKNENLNFNKINTFSKCNNKINKTNKKKKKNYSSQNLSVLSHVIIRASSFHSLYPTFVLRSHPNQIPLAAMSYSRVTDPSHAQIAIHKPHLQIKYKLCFSNSALYFHDEDGAKYIWKMMKRSSLSSNNTNYFSTSTQSSFTSDSNDYNFSNSLFPNIPNDPTENTFTFSFSQFSLFKSPVKNEYANIWSRVRDCFHSSSNPLYPYVLLKKSPNNNITPVNSTLKSSVRLKHKLHQYPSSALTSPTQNIPLLAPGNSITENVVPLISLDSSDDNNNLNKDITAQQINNEKFDIEEELKEENEADWEIIAKIVYSTQLASTGKSQFWRIEMNENDNNKEFNKTISNPSSTPSFNSLSFNSSTHSSLVITSAWIFMNTHHKWRSLSSINKSPWDESTVEYTKLSECNNSEDCLECNDYTF